MSWIIDEASSLTSVPTLSRKLNSLNRFSIETDFELLDCGTGLVTCLDSLVDARVLAPVAELVETEGLASTLRDLPLLSGDNGLSGLFCQTCSLSAQHKTLLGADFNLRPERRQFRNMLCHPPPTTR